ncbi:MAG: hypothetical protein GY703_06335 [Gammaproteobacteria bacterium]|nr:hypothetical protein [Gammaproteobacteria bacterium]
MKKCSQRLEWYLGSDIRNQERVVIRAQEANGCTGHLVGVRDGWVYDSSLTGPAKPVRCTADGMRQLGIVGIVQMWRLVDTKRPPLKHVRPSTNKRKLRHQKKKRERMNQAESQMRRTQGFKWSAKKQCVDTL